MALTDYENALKSFIHDDDKLVTYKWISKEFEIHVNVAKDILKQYWEKYRNEESIIATFLLMGQLKDGSMRVEVVKQSNLKVAKEKFIKVDCEHLYSLQKSLQDIELLAFAGEGDLRFSAIKCNEKFIRNDEEIESLRYVGNVKKEDIKSAGINKISSKLPEKQESKNVHDLSTKEKESKNNDAGSKEKTKNKKKGLMEKEKSRENEKCNESKSENKVSPTEKKAEKKVSPISKTNSNAQLNGKSSKKPVQSKQSGFNNLFGKVQAKPQASNKPKEDTNIDEKKTNFSDIKEKEEIIGQEKENRNQEDTMEMKRVPKAEKKVVSKSKSKSTKEIRGQKRNRSQETNTSSKRKRIVIADSSDEESNKSNEEEEEEEPMEIMEEPPRMAKKRSPSPPAEKRENGKRMVRKTIDKTFKDEDGYLVTKRVHVYEAISDNEDSAENKKQEPKKAKPAETKVETKKKQTTLINFFKKS